MKDALRQRRKEMWEMMVVRGMPKANVVKRIAADYDIAESTVRSDLSRMDEWLPKIQDAVLASGVSRIAELRRNRQQMQRLADQFERQEEYAEKRRTLRAIDKNIEQDIDLSQSLGLTDKEPDRQQTELSVSSQDLDDDERRVLDNLTSSSGSSATDVHANGQGTGAPPLTDHNSN